MRKQEEALLKGYESLNGTWDEPVVWLALAFCEWKKGRLSERVKKRAIEIIDSGEDLQHWKESSAPKECRQREKELQKLKARLESPMPERRPGEKADSGSGALESGGSSGVQNYGS